MKKKCNVVCKVQVSSLTLELSTHLQQNVKHNLNINMCTIFYIYIRFIFQ